VKVDKKTKITKRNVDALLPSQARYTVWDTDVAGFGVRVAPTGRKTYVLRYRVDGGRGGRDREPAIGLHGSLTPDQAREIARSWAAKVASGGDPAGDRNTRRDAPTMTALLERYLAEHVVVRNKPGTATNIRAMVEKVIRPALGKIRAADVTRADIIRFHAGLRGTPYAANRALAALSKAFSLAEAWGLRPDHSNPCVHVQRYAEISRERYLTPEEFSRLSQMLDAAEDGTLKVKMHEGSHETVYVNSEVVTAIRLLLVTGARVGEILGLRWAYIDWSAQCAKLPDSKTGKKTMQLPEQAMKILESLDGRRGGKGYVIRGRDGSDPEKALVNVKDTWSVVRKAAGLDDVRLHDLRHSFASVAVTGGMSLPVLGALLGHRETRTTQRYAHLANESLRQAASQVASTISEAMQKPRKPKRPEDDA
jgi:integrase